MESKNDNPENNAVQDRKSIWKLLKQQKKEAKRSKREEEFLANLRKPKDTKVVLADKSFVEKLRNENVSSPAKRAPGFLARDFPALSATASFPKPPPKRKEKMAYSNAVNNSIANLYFPTIEDSKESKEKKAEEESNCGNSSSATATTVAGDVAPEAAAEDAGDAEEIDLILSARPTPKKNTKRKDPLVLYSRDLISQSKKNKLKTDRNKMISGSKNRRKPEVGVLSGNMLDSSNPIRKRGKHREVEKLKLSKLKLAIIRDRILKQKKINSSAGEVVMDSKQLKTEIDEYLSKLTKIKLELSEQRRKRCEGKKTEGVNSSEVIPEEATPEKVTSEKVTPEEVTPAESKCNDKVAKKKQPKYRKYCDNGYSLGLDESVRNLITGIVYLQDRAFNTDFIKARAKQKHVVGLREVKKYLMLNKIKMVVVAPDLEAKDAVYSVVEDLKKTASLQNVPCVFALSRRMLGQATKKGVPVSAFGVMNYEGLEDKFVEVKENLEEAQNKCKRDNCAIGNAGSNSSEVADVDGKIEDFGSNTEKSVSLEEESDRVSHTNKKNKKSKKDKRYTVN